MAMTVAPSTETDKALLLAITHASDTARAVDEVADEMLDNSTHQIDLDNFAYYKVRDIQAALAVLNKIIRSDWEVGLMAVEERHVQLLADSVDRARQLTVAIREALSEL